MKMSFSSSLLLFYLQTYCSLPLSQLQHIRYSILNFFQDDKVKVSIFQQEGNQRLDGSFVYNAVTKLEKGIIYFCIIELIISLSLCVLLAKLEQRTFQEYLHLEKLKYLTPRAKWWWNLNFSRVLHMSMQITKEVLEYTKQETEEQG